MFENLTASLNPSAIQCFGLGLPASNAITKVLKEYTRGLGDELTGYLSVLDRDGVLRRKLHHEAGPFQGAEYIVGKIPKAQTATVPSYRSNFERFLAEDCNITLSKGSGTLFNREQPKLEGAGVDQLTTLARYFGPFDGTKFLELLRDIALAPGGSHKSNSGFNAMGEFLFALQQEMRSKGALERGGRFDAQKIVTPRLKLFNQDRGIFDSVAKGIQFLNTLLSHEKIHMHVLSYRELYSPTSKSASEKVA